MSFNETLVHTPAYKACYHLMNPRLGDDYAAKRIALGAAKEVTSILRARPVVIALVLTVAIVVMCVLAVNTSSLHVHYSRLELSKPVGPTSSLSVEFLFLLRTSGTCLDISAVTCLSCV